MVYRGGCHCGQIEFEFEFEVSGDIGIVYECNCSVCTKKAYLHRIVLRSAFRLLSDEGALATYRFNTMQAKHHFCPTCGCAPFYVARSDPDQIDVNVRCVDGVDLATLTIEPFDGQNWEQAYAATWPTRERS